MEASSVCAALIELVYEVDCGSSAPTSLTSFKTIPFDQESRSETVEIVERLLYIFRFYIIVCVFIEREMV